MTFLDALRRTRVSRIRSSRHGLYGKPDLFFTLLFSRRSDRWRWGALGELVWRSRRVAGWTRDAEESRSARAGELRILPDEAIVVEIGSFLGCSSVLLAGARKLRGSGKVGFASIRSTGGETHFRRQSTGRSRTTDRSPFRGPLREEPRAGASREWVEVHQARAEDAVSSWRAPIDLLFLDGHQSYDVVMQSFTPGHRS